LGVCWGGAERVYKPLMTVIETSQGVRGLWHICCYISRPLEKVKLCDLEGCHFEVGNWLLHLRTGQFPLLRIRRVGGEWGGEGV
jgi:hypothetical protein